VLVELVGEVVNDDSVWLMEISWSSWFSDTIWLTISVGSTGCVGSWFCNSVTRRLRNVVCRSLAEVPFELLLEPLELLVPLVPAVAFALAVCPCSGALTNGLNPCTFIVVFSS
jgi:hypothetical protein